MAKIVIASSSIAGAHNYYEATLIGRALSAAGFEVLHIVDDIPAMKAAADNPDELVVAQAPVLEKKSVTRNPAGTGIQDLALQLAQSGFADPESLRPLARAWTALLRSVHADAIISLSASVAWLVGPHLAPTFAVGSGRSLPPNVPTASPSREDGGGIRSMLAATNAVLDELQFERIAALPDILWRCQQLHFGLDLLDPFAAARQTPSAGVLVPAPTTPFDPEKQRLSVFLDARYPRIDLVVLALTGLAELRLDVFVQNMSTAIERYLSSLPHVSLHRTPGPALVQAKYAAAIVHHGDLLAAEQGLMFGRPHMVLPWTDEQKLVLECLKQVGVAWWKEPGRPIDELASTVRGVLEDPAIRFAAENVQGVILANDISSGVQAIVDAVGRALPQTMPAKEVPVVIASAEDIGTSIEMAEAEPPPLAASPAPPVTESKVFCAMPFQHMCIGIEGTARICCMVPNMVSENGAPMSLYANTVEEVWNSDYMREVRRKVLADEPLSECQVCYDNEEATGTSYRTNAGLQPLIGTPVDMEALHRDAIANDYRVETKPQFVKLELGNLCNLKCRMCWAGNSSEIERDPVHSMWAGGADPMHAAWQGEYAAIGPDSKIGVLRSGVHELEKMNGAHWCWTDGAARFNIPLAPFSRPNRILLDFKQDVAYSRLCQVSVNGKPVFAERIDESVEQRIVNIDADPATRELTLEIRSERVWNQTAKRWEGLPLKNIRLQRHVADEERLQQTVLKPRLETPGLWYKNDTLVFKELLGDAKDLKRLYVTGGEPMLESRYSEIIDYLIAKGVEGDIDLELTTNGTLVDHELIDKLARFKSMLLTISVDGIGAVQEYIRYPARWPTIAKNIEAMKRPSIEVCAIPVVQAYNMLDLANICRFGRDLGIGVSLMNNVHDPYWLRTQVMPNNVHRLAAARLREVIAEGCNEYLRNQAQTLADYFDAHEAPLDHETLGTFNLFTNDLDVSRGQNFRQSLPELHAMIVEAGYEWHDATLHAGKMGPRRPARERTHAWI